MAEMEASDLQPTLSIPERPSDACSGSIFTADILELPLGQAREDAIYEQFIAGNVPAFMRQLCPISTVGMSVGGQSRLAVVWVTPDYLCIGSDEDYVRIPMSPRTAQRIADSYGAFLPTRRVVDDVHAVAVKISPRPMAPSRLMSSVAYFVNHNDLIQEQLRERGAELGQLISGHKKDIVLCKALENGHDDRVAIYGWCFADGKPIQGLNASSHNWIYSDYSHGVRLVAHKMLVNGDARSYDEVLTDPSVAGMISDEGFLSITRYPNT